MNYKNKKILREMCVNNVWVLWDIMSDDIESKRLGRQKRRYGECCCGGNMLEKGKKML